MLNDADRGFLVSISLSGWILVEARYMALDLILNDPALSIGFGLPFTE